MNKEYIETLINIYSDEKSNKNLNIFLSKKNAICEKFKMLNNIFKNFSLFIYFIIVGYFAFYFLDNLFIGEKLDYLEGVLFFLSFVSILFWFVINDFFNYILNTIYGVYYKNIKSNIIKNEKDIAILKLIQKLNMLDNLNLKQKIEYKLQEIQDQNHDLLKNFYKSYKFNNSEIKEFIHFLIEQSNSEDEY